MYENIMVQKKRESPESAAKWIVTDHLAKMAAGNSSLVTSEVGKKKTGVRADLVLCSGVTFTAFEIKTNRDNLRRLPSQISAYKKYFDSCVLVVDVKHLAAVKRISPKSVGIWLYNFEGVTELRSPSNASPRKKDLVQLLPMKELRRLSGIKVASPSLLKRPQLEEKVSRLPLKVIKTAVRDAYWCKYKKVSLEIASDSREKVADSYLSLQSLSRNDRPKNNPYATWERNWRLFQSTQSSSSSSVSAARSE